MKRCGELGCNNRFYAKEKCKKHYDAQRTPEISKTLWLKRQHGMVQDELDIIWKSQDGRCGICYETIPSSGFNKQIDHDHTVNCGCTGRKTCIRCRRGLLCPKCNKLIGLAHDDISILLSAIKYLEDHSKK